MGVSIYYSAKRDTALSDGERSAIADAIRRYSVEKAIDQYQRIGVGLNWESFCVYNPDNPNDPLDPGVIFQGATRLPSNREDAVEIGARHWCRALAAIRRILHDAEWNVHIDDCPIKWDEKKKEYDLEP